MPIAAPADRRFHRATVKPQRRRRQEGPSWRTIATTTGVVLVALGVVALGLRSLLRSDLLLVRDVQIEGTERMPEGIVREVMADVVGRSMFRLDLDEWRDKVQALSWVAGVTVRRRLPTTVVVEIVERQPMAIGRIGDTLNIIDRRGVIIDAYGPLYKNVDLPIVDGLAYVDEEEVGALEQSRASLAVRLFGELQRSGDLAARVSQVDVSDPSNAVVVMKGDTALLQLGDQHFAQRLQSYLDLAQTLRDGVPNADTVDLRYGTKIFVTSGRADAGRDRTAGGEE